MAQMMCRKKQLCKIGESLALVLLWMCMGLYGGLTPIARPSLRAQINATVKQMNLVVGFKRIGEILGATFGGILHDKFQGRSYVFLAASLTLAGVVIIPQPWTSDAVELGALLTIEGTTKGVIEASGNSYIMRHLGDRSTYTVHAIHFGYSVGALLTPLIITPFMPPTDTNNSTTALPNIDTTIVYGTSTVESMDPATASQIETPYIISGGITLATALLFWILCFRTCYSDGTLELSPKMPWKSVFNPDTWSPGHKHWAAGLVGIFVAWSIALEGSQSVYSYSSSFVSEAEDFDFTETETFWYFLTRSLAGAFGRLLGFILSNYISIQILLATEVTITCIASIFMAALGVRHKIALWLFTFLVTMASSSALPAAYTFINKYLTLHSVIISCVMCGVGGFSFFYTWLYSYLFDNVMIETIFYTSASCSGLFLVFHLIMQRVASIRGPREDDD